MTDITLQLNLRRHQLHAFNTRRRFNVRVWHRRAGKTFYRIAEKLADALGSPLPDYRAYYIAPTYKQAKSVAWDYLRLFTKDIPQTSTNEAELRVDLPNGARIRLLGAEDYDSLRGLYADDLTLDETALIPSAAWNMVLSPMLADRRGRATFIGTPMGRMNLFHEQFQYALTSDDPDWTQEVLTYRDTDVLDAREVERMRRTMRPEEFAQELECSWNAALRGAYFVREMEAMQASRRITRVAYERALPVTASLDLGWSDAMIAGFWQRVGSERRCLRAIAVQGTSIPDMLASWKGLGFPIARVILPHDAKVHELGLGMTRQEVFHSLGYDTVIAPDVGLHEGIEQTRQMLPHTWMDAEGCTQLVEAMLAYRSQYDEVKNVHSMKPVHDWSSHWADMVRYYAVGEGAALEASASASWGPRPRAQLGVYA